MAPPHEPCPSVCTAVDPKCITGRQLKRTLPRRINSLCPSSSVLPSQTGMGMSQNRLPCLRSSQDATLHLPAFLEAVDLRHTVTNLEEPRVSPKVNWTRAWPWLCRHYLRSTGLDTPFGMGRGQLMTNLCRHQDST